MEGERKAQTQNRTDKESTKDHLLLPVDFPRWSNEKVNGRANEHDATEQMSPGKFIASQTIRGRRYFPRLPNVASLRVESKDGFEAGGE